jgi:hypothetical protein
VDQGIFLPFFKLVTLRNNDESRKKRSENWSESKQMKTRISMEELRKVAFVTSPVTTNLHTNGDWLLLTTPYHVNNSAQVPSSTRGCDLGRQLIGCLIFLAAQPIDFTWLELSPADVIWLVLSPDDFTWLVLFYLIESQLMKVS